MALRRRALRRLVGRRAYVTLNRQPFLCVACGGSEFWDREIKLNSTVAELAGLAWANKSALGVICATCGYVHEFVGDAVELWEIPRPDIRRRRRPPDRPRSGYRTPLRAPIAEYALAPERMP